MIKTNSHHIEQKFWDNRAERIEEEYCKAPEYEAIAIKKLGKVQNRKVLEIGTGTGRVSAALERKRATVVGVDLSFSMLKLVKNKTKSTHLIQMRAEELGFKKEQFDAIIGVYILHHTDIKKAIPEIARVLKNGGQAVFVENFAFNPLLNFSRKYIVGRLGIKRLGTCEEKPLNTSDLKFIRKYFHELRVEPEKVLFAKLFARQVFHYKNNTINRIATIIDNWIKKSSNSLAYCSYTQLLILRK